MLSPAPAAHLAMRMGAAGWAPSDDRARALLALLRRANKQQSSCHRSSSGRRSHACQTASAAFRSPHPAAAVSVRHAA